MKRFLLAVAMAALVAPTAGAALAEAAESLAGFDAAMVETGGAPAIGTAVVALDSAGPGRLRMMTRAPAMLARLQRSALRDIPIRSLAIVPPNGAPELHLLEVRVARWSSVAGAADAVEVELEYERVR